MPRRKTETLECGEVVFFSRRLLEQEIRRHMRILERRFRAHLAENMAEIPQDEIDQGLWGKTSAESLARDVWEGIL
jgi:hypothetical protein